MTAESQVSVRQLKNETTRILRRVEAGERVTVTKRGRPVAVIEPSIQTSPASDSIYRRLQGQIEARISGLRRIPSAEAQREFERISHKVSRNLSYQDWREMDRAAKGDRFGCSR